MNGFIPTTMRMQNRWKDDLAPLWLLTPDEVGTLASLGPLVIESIMGEQQVVSAGEALESVVSDTRNFRLNGESISLTSWGVRGSELTRINETRTTA